MAESKVVELDVREDIKNKLEPFQKIMEAIDPCRLVTPYPSCSIQTDSFVYGYES